MSKAIETLLNERLRQHRENLKLWESGYLTPTEPEEEERWLIKERLKAVILEVEYLLKTYKEY